MAEPVVEDDVRLLLEKSANWGWSLACTSMTENEISEDQ
jgi:hypothetical protein